MVRLASARCRHPDLFGAKSMKAGLVGGVTIPTNIVDGCGASSQKEFARYLDISIKSTLNN